MKQEQGIWIAIYLIVFLSVLCPVSVPRTSGPAQAFAGDIGFDAEIKAARENPRAELQETRSLFMASLKVIGSLGLVLGLMLAFMIWLKKTGLTKGSLKGRSLIRILDTRMVAPKKYVCVLNIAGDFVVIGISEQQINMLTRLENSGELIDYAAAEQQNSLRSPASSFSIFLEKAAKTVTRSKQQD